MDQSATTLTELLDSGDTRLHMMQFLALDRRRVGWVATNGPGSFDDHDDDNHGVV